MRKYTLFVFAIAIILFSVATILPQLCKNASAAPLQQAAPVPRVINYQGRLTDAAGNPLTGSYPMVFTLYAAPTDGTALWTETQTVVLDAGVFNVLLGKVTPIPTSVFTTADLYLGVRVGDDAEMTPRRKVVSVGFAYRAEAANTAAQADTAANATTAGNADTVDGRHASDLAPVAHTHAALSGPDGSPANALLVDTAGDVSIGEAMAGARLAVEVNAGGGAGMVEPLRLFESDGPYTQEFGGLRIRYDGSTGEVRFEATRGGYYFAGAGGKFLTFHTNPDGDSISYEQMRIDKSGRVGIGTASPAATLDVDGSFHASGTKSAVVQTEAYGTRALYTIEAPDVRFSDEGLAQVEAGMARVDLDPIFLATIEGPFLVHVTPYGDASLYVAEIGDGYFVVKVHDGDPNVAFAWRLSAYRKGYAGVRLESVIQPEE